MAEIHSPSPDSPKPSLAELAVGFLEIGLFGFGGVAPIARHVIVEKRRWLDDRDYAAVLGVGQILPGANTVNAAVLIGDRFRGIAGAFVAVTALLVMPVAILVAVIPIYDRFAALPDVRAAMLGLAATAAGLVVGTSLKLARRHQARSARHFGMPGDFRGGRAGCGCRSFPSCSSPRLAA